MKMMICPVFAILTALSFADESLVVEMLPGESWWGVANSFGSQMPFNAKTSLTIDLRKDNFSNQSASFLVSDRGREIWCETQASFTFKAGTISITGATTPIELVQNGKTLKEAFLDGARRHFPSDGKTPDLTFFRAPQYNTWIELTYHQNEKDILTYAHSMLDHDLPAGVFMIDDTWQAGYGDWRFEPTRFKDPKGMCDKLHAMGFKVVLWMCPWVGMDLPAYRRIAWGRNPNDVRGYPAKGGFVLDPKTKNPAAVEWWNGVSAMLDLTHPNGRDWFKEQLDGLVKDYGVDGFKFDGGGLMRYARGYLAHDAKASSGDQVLAYAKYSLEYPVCEYRNVWRLQGQPVVMRLFDKMHSWEHLQLLMPDLIAGGLLGYPFMCPDMIGGGNWIAFIPGSGFEEELYIRSAQVHALCGMMQFSASPWRCLSQENQKIIANLVKMRQEKFAEKFVRLARMSGHTGEPMIRHLEYNYPGQGYANIRDEFMMGDDLLVAPVVEKGATSRKVVLPPGKWTADDGKVFEGPTTITVRAPLSRLPHFMRQ